MTYTEIFILSGLVGFVVYITIFAIVLRIKG